MAWTTPRSWVAGEVVTAALLNTHLRDQLNEFTAWTAYTPSVSGIVVGNGTLVGTFARVRETIHFQVQLTFGSTTTVPASGASTITLPAEPKAGILPSFEGEAYDTSAGGSIQIRTPGTSTTSMILLVPDTTASGYDRVLTSAAPFPWAVNDRIYVAGTYQRA